MNKTTNSNLTRYSQTLRRNMTAEERHLWYDFLKPLPITIHRQKVIDNYILDFYCASKKLGIELDGSQHYFDKGKNYDRIREERLRQLGISIVRYSNYDVKYHFEEVCEDLMNRLR